MNKISEIKLEELTIDDVKTNKYDDKTLAQLEERTRRFMNYDNYQPIKSRLDKQLIILDTSKKIRKTQKELDVLVLIEKQSLPIKSTILIGYNFIGRRMKTQPSSSIYECLKKQTEHVDVLNKLLKQEYQESVETLRKLEKERTKTANDIIKGYDKIGELSGSLDKALEEAMPKKNHLEKIKMNSKEYFERKNEYETLRTNINFLARESGLTMQKTKNNIHFEKSCEQMKMFLETSIYATQVCQENANSLLKQTVIAAKSYELLASKQCLQKMLCDDVQYMSISVIKLHNNVYIGMSSMLRGLAGNNQIESTMTKSIDD